MSDALKLSFGYPYPTSTNTAISTTFGMSASTSQLEFIFQAYEAITISRLWYRHTAATAAPIYQISLQGVDLTTGNPDGVIKSSGNAKATFTPVSGNNNVGQWANLTSSYTCTRGELLAIVISYSSGTIGASNSATFTQTMNDSNIVPYSIQNSAGTRTRSLNRPTYGYGSASLAYGNPIAGILQQGFNDGTNPDEYALRFIVPATWFSSYKIAGMRATIQPPPTGSSLTWTLYDGTTALQSFSHDSDYQNAVFSDPATIYFTDATLATLTPGNVYRLAVKNNHASTNMLLFVHQVSANADFAAYPGGIEWYQSSRNNGGAWTDLTTSRPYIEPIFSDFTGGTSKPLRVGMQGGLAA